ncbi:hypothetical protein AAG906_012432 [Vitis piasezkii]
MNLEERLRSAIYVWRQHSPIGEGHCGAVADVNLMWAPLSASSSVRLTWHSSILKALQVSFPLRCCNASLGNRKNIVLAPLQAFLVTPSGRALLWCRFRGSALLALGTTPLGTDKPAPTPLQPPLLPNHSKPNPIWPNDGLKWKEHVIIVLNAKTEQRALWKMGAIQSHESNDNEALNSEAIRVQYRGDRAKTFLDRIANRFSQMKRLRQTLFLVSLSPCVQREREYKEKYIMEMSNLVTRLKALKLELSRHTVLGLDLSPIQFSPFKITYCSCVQEDERLKQEKIESVRLDSTSRGFVPIDTWWIDTGATTYISVTM